MIATAPRTEWPDTSRVGLDISRLGGRRSENKECPKTLKKTLFQSIFSRLPVLGSPNGREEIVQAILGSREILNRTMSEFEALIDRCVWESIEVRTDEKHRGQTDALRHQVWNEISTKLPRLGIDHPNLLTFDTLQRPVPELLALARNASARSADHAVDRCYGYLESLHDARLIGRIRHGADNVREYDFPRHVIIRMQTDERAAINTKDKWIKKTWGDRWEMRLQRKTTRRTERDQYEERRLAHHTHLIFDSTIHPLPAKCLRQPDWVAKAISVAPAWAACVMGVAAGKMARERIVEMELRKKTWTEVSEEHDMAETVEAEGRLWSPGLLFDDYVLVGWSDRDLPAQKGIRRFFNW